MLAVLLRVFAAACGLVAAFCWLKAGYHQWAKRGTTGALFGYTFLGLLTSGLALGALAIAERLQSI